VARYALGGGATGLFVDSPLWRGAGLLLTSAGCKCCWLSRLGMPVPVHPLGLLLLSPPTGAAFLALGMVTPCWWDNV